ncbi:hypothetical protein WR25_02822 [Diploscapter pachys]|uniref:CRAL-TRIO domain-containing protein n=1 Tax=Diploscapter pachys TaxID=2018661 RepID=A0A2A2KGK2_9BILA|nr:hypothetical protein WR25_02822 [Diploscapter pachys]
MPISDDDKQLAAELAKRANGSEQSYCQHEDNLHRWLVAYERDVDKAAAALKRHLNIRQIMEIEKLADGDIEIEEQVEKYAPMTILGRNHPDDNKIVIFEQSGKIDIGGLVDNLQMTSFMQAKFRLMEKLHRRVVEEEKRHDQMGGAVLIMDLEGIEFSTKLLSMLTGPYRIMWGTLFDQYPQIIQQIIIVNAPSFVNVLHTACSPFLPNDYKSKIHISSSSARNYLPTVIHASCLPEELGGYAKMTLSIDDECELAVPLCEPIRPIPKPKVREVQLDSVTVPAGWDI